MTKEEIGSIFKERRKYLNLTQKDLAEIIGIGLRSLVDIENGIGNPSLDQLQKITKSLGLKIEIRIK